MEAGEEPDSITEVRTLIDVPEKKYRTGLVETQVTFDQKGLYAAILTIGGEELTIPVRVGIEKEIPLARRISNIVLGVLILSILGYVLYHFRLQILAKIKIKSIAHLYLKIDTPIAQLQCRQENIYAWVVGCFC